MFPIVSPATTNGLAEEGWNVSEVILFCVSFVMVPSVRERCENCCMSDVSVVSIATSVPCEQQR